MLAAAAARSMTEAAFPLHLLHPSHAPLPPLENKRDLFRAFVDTVFVGVMNSVHSIFFFFLFHNNSTRQIFFKIDILSDDEVGKELFDISFTITLICSCLLISHLT